MSARLAALAVALGVLTLAPPAWAQQGRPTPTPTPNSPVEARPTVPPADAPPSAPTVGPVGSTATADEPPVVPDGPQPLRLNAATEAAVQGRWALDRAENLPPGEELVFMRLVFDDGRVATTSVYLDPDDGDLRGRRRLDRYRVSDGQLIIRDGYDISVVDVTPEANRLMLRDVQTRVVLYLRREEPLLLVDPTLVGTWSVAPPAHREAITIAFQSDGRAVGTSGGDEFDVEYEGAGAYVLIDNRDTFRYTVLGDRLLLERGDELIDLARVESNR